MRSYMANMKHGTMTSTISNAAALVGIALRVKKKSGKPKAAAPPKHTICRLVSPNANFVFIRVRSFGIET
ncbi:hypothetical protein FACS1894127_4410 [Clostridia bacterium]|nr:hypothetical protein FACS1894127_4410 [Clostridia bacterium]